MNGLETELQHQNWPPPLTSGLHLLIHWFQCSVLMSGSSQLPEQPGFEYQQEKPHGLCLSVHGCYHGDVTTISWISVKLVLSFVALFDPTLTVFLPTCLDPLVNPRQSPLSWAEGKLHVNMENTSNVVEFCCCGNRSCPLWRMPRILSLNNDMEKEWDTEGQELLCGLVFCFFWPLTINCPSNDCFII